MKLKYALMISFLVIVLSIGAVSASDDNQDLSAGSEIITDDVLSDDGVVNDDFEDYDEDFEDDDYLDEDDGDSYQINVNEAAEYVYYLDDVEIASLTLPSDAYGYVAAYDGGYDEGDFIAMFPLKQGHVSIKLSDLQFPEETRLGTHFLEFIYEADDYYVDDGDVIVNIIDYEFKAPETVFLGEDAKYILDLHNNITGTLYVTEKIEDIDGDYLNGEVTYYDVINGSAEVVFSNLSMGTHIYSFDFDEDEYFFNREVFLYVYPNVKVKDRVTIGKDSIVDVKLPGDAQGTFSISLYSDELSDIIDYDVEYENGKVQFPSIGLFAGMYDVVGFEINDYKYGSINFEETPQSYTGDGIYASFKAVNPSNVVVSTNSISPLYTTTGIYKIKVTIAGKAVKGAMVLFELGDDEVQVYTDSNGYASLKIKKNPGTYKVKAKVLGKTVTKKITVKHLVTLKTVAVKKSAKKLILQASLAKVNKKYLKSKLITFKFNGKTYKAKTNSKGVAKVTIKSSVLKKLKAGKKITYQATYLKDTVKKSVKVKK
ncbi:MAG: hypothetical protein E7Z81_10440 [Methanobrevibacter sp.]|uniref:hypothetical protein n=1 Tax=Methanobrevibacter sp. TaxID=66852 RepID=UPI0025D3A2BA|nr:hypothetical protein [Methanobrevibacter sp.]MBE6498664.1 hypothetical protein [Methanobrevibacter sp.]